MFFSSGRSSEDYLTIVKSKIRTRPRFRKNVPIQIFYTTDWTKRIRATDQAQKSGPTMLQYKLGLFTSELKNIKSSNSKLQQKHLENVQFEKTKILHFQFFHQLIPILKFHPIKRKILIH